MQTSKTPSTPSNIKNCVGLDLSLTATGITILSGGKKIYSGVIKSKPTGKKPTDELLRLKSIVQSIGDILANNGVEPDLVAIENLAFGVRNATALTQLAGLNYFVRDMCRYRGWPFILVAPMTLKKFITGSGKSDKNVMLLETFKRYGESFLNDNESDSYGLAQIGRLFCDDAQTTVSSKNLIALIGTQL